MEYVLAPFAGFVTMFAHPGQQVDATTPIAMIEALKMEAGIYPSNDGVVQRVAFTVPQQVSGGELLAVITDQ